MLVSTGYLRNELMRVLMLNTSDVAGGAAKAAHALHTALRAQKVDTQLLVQDRRTTDASIQQPRSRLTRSLAAWRPLLDTLPLLAYRGRPVTHWATQWCPTHLANEVRSRQPDLVHVHWICGGFLSIADLGRLPPPVVWTLHDSWAFTGGCHVPGDCVRYQEHCGACPQLASAHAHDLSRWIWHRKQRHWRDLRFTIVAPSRWLAACARRSALLHEARIEVIPNGLDPKIYRPLARADARRLLQLPPDKKLILFSAMNASRDRNKGQHLLLPALRELAAAGWAQRAELLIAGETAPVAPPDSGLPVRYLGVLQDDEAMTRLYSAADLVVVPSLSENFSNTILEAMACGTPVIAFDIGGNRDQIAHEQSGWLARPFEPTDLARGLGTALGDDSLRLAWGRRARELLLARFTADDMARRYAALYTELLT